MAASSDDTALFHLLNGLGIVAVIVALGVVFNENLLAYQDCGDRPAGRGCLDAGTPVSLGLVVIGGSAVLMAAFSAGRQRMARGRRGFWSPLAGLVAIALLTLAALGVVAFSTR